MVRFGRTRPCIDDEDDDDDDDVVDCGEEKIEVSHS